MYQRMRAQHKMASSILVADYGSSDSENEEETSFEKTKVGKKGLELPGVNLLASTQDNSDSDTDSDTSSKGLTKNSTASTKQRANTNDGSKPEKLPLPSVLGIDSSIQQSASGTSSLAPSSIFANPFEEAEQHKLSILEQHVKLTTAQRKEAALGGKKKICWKFRNGRCRFGHKCKFAHDSDIPSTLVAGNQDESPGDSSTDDRAGYQEYIGGVCNQGAWSEQGEGGEDEEGQLKRKRRPGLSQTLVPSKKVMTAYARQKNHESPWSQHR